MKAKICFIHPAHPKIRANRGPDTSLRHARRPCARVLVADAGEGFGQFLKTWAVPLPARPMTSDVSLPRFCMACPMLAASPSASTSLKATN